MKIVVFGGGGQVGKELLSRFATLVAQGAVIDIHAPRSQELDVSSRESVLAQCAAHKPDLIINCAAYTAVDKAEEEKERAYAVNGEAVRFIAEAALASNARVIHVSTDYVFPGTGKVPLIESDRTDPVSVYGASKLEGEKILQEMLGDRSVILRTSSVHGQHGVNFVHTMLKLFGERDEVQVVEDQWMSPTWAGLLADVIVSLSQKEKVHGVFHVSGAGAVSWYEFAKAIHEYATPASGEKHRATVKTTTVAAFVRPAKRPQYSVFNCAKIESIIGAPLLTWQQGLKNHLRDIGRLRGKAGEKV